MKPWEYKPQPIVPLGPREDELLEHLRQHPYPAPAPCTLEDFHAQDHYPKVQDGELLLVDSDGQPARDPTILTAWQAVKGEIRAGLEARYQALTAWAENLLAEHGVYLTTPDDITCEWETSTRVDDPQRLAAEALRCEACGMYYKVRTAHLWQAYRAREGVN
jgi:hypothetical protein